MVVVPSSAPFILTKICLQNFYRFISFIFSPIPSPWSEEEEGANINFYNGIKQHLSQVFKSWGWGSRSSSLPLRGREGAKSRNSAHCIDILSVKFYCNIKLQFFPTPSPLERDEDGEVFFFTVTVKLYFSQVFEIWGTYLSIKFRVMAPSPPTFEVGAPVSKFDLHLDYICKFSLQLVNLFWNCSSSSTPTLHFYSLGARGRANKFVFTVWALSYNCATNPYNWRHIFLII